MRLRYYDTNQFIYTIISDCIGGDVYADGILVGKIPDQGRFVYESDSGHDIVFSISYNKSTLQETITETNEVEDMRVSESVPIKREFSVDVSDEVRLDYEFLFGTFIDEYSVHVIQKLSSPSPQTCKAGQTVTMNAVQSTIQQKGLISTSFKQNSEIGFNLYYEENGKNIAYRYASNDAIIDPKSGDYPAGLVITTNGAGLHTTMSAWINYWENQWSRNVKIRIFSTNVPGTYITANINVTV